MRVFPERPAPIPMDADTQLRVCLAVAEAHVTHVCDDLDRMFAVDVPFGKVCENPELYNHASLMAYGFEADEREIQQLVRDGYSLCNYRPGRLSVHYPDRMGGGLYTYVIGELAEKYRPR